MRYRPVITALSSLLTLTLWLEIGALGAVLLMLAVTIGTDEGALLSAWPVTVPEQPLTPALTPAGPGLTSLSVAVYSGSIRFTADSWGYYLLKVLDAGFELGVAIGITVLLRRVFRLLQPQPFTEANARRLRLIALLVLALAPYSLLKSLVYRAYLVHHVARPPGAFAGLLRASPGKLAPGELWLDLNLNGQALLVGLVLLLVAEVFRLGVLMRQDNESIV